MPFIIFLGGALFISLSGVMAPGPLTAVTLGKGSESPHAGVMIAIGHGIVEFPLMLFLFFGLGDIITLPYIKGIIGLAGGIFIIFMGTNMIREIKKVEAGSNSEPYRYSSLVSGIMLSLTNPYFLIWWATVGITLILGSMKFGILGFVIFAIAHWLCDLFWYYLLSSLSFKGSQFFGNRLQKTIFAVCGIALLFFGAKFILDAQKIFTGL